MAITVITKLDKNGCMWYRMEEYLNCVCKKNNFINLCPKSLIMYLREQPPKSLYDMASIVNQQAHDQRLNATDQKSFQENSSCLTVSEHCKHTDYKASKSPKLKSSYLVKITYRCLICDQAEHLSRLQNERGKKNKRQTVLFKVF